MSGAYFLTATGTDIGKTYLAERLIAGWRTRGLTVAACKPAQSGFADDQAQASDAGRLLAALGRDITPDALDEICPFRYPAARAPDAAARLQGEKLTRAELLRPCRKALAGGSERILIEGAGGILSPIAEDALNIDIAAELGLPLIIVGGAYLGAISHILSAVECATARGFAIECIVINHFVGASAEIVETTADDVRRRLTIDALVSEIHPEQSEIDWISDL